LVGTGELDGVGVCEGVADSEADWENDFEFRSLALCDCDCVGMYDCEALILSGTAVMLRTMVEGEE